MCSNNHIEIKVVLICKIYSVIRAPEMDELKVSLCTPPQTCDGVSVWEWSGSALDEGQEASEWFTHYLGKPSRLVRFNKGYVILFCVYTIASCTKLPVIQVNYLWQFGQAIYLSKF